MLLRNKIAVVYGGGAIVGAVARASACEGASVFLAGCSQEKLDIVASDIRSAGGTAETAVVDALDKQDVRRFIDSIVEQVGRIDISFNVIGIHDIQKPLFEISLDNFLQRVTNATRTQFLTSMAAARHMKQSGSGVILQFGGGGPQTMPGLGGFKVSLDAMESFRRQLAVELGEHGIRVVTLKTGGIPDSIPDDVAPRDQIAAAVKEGTLLNRAATLEDVGNVAAFVASDGARTITGTEINISAGSIVD